VNSITAPSKAGSANWRTTVLHPDNKLFIYYFISELYYCSCQSRLRQLADNCATPR
jgi:hypothetical protein